MRHNAFANGPIEHLLLLEACQAMKKEDIKREKIEGRSDRVIAKNAQIT
jgi:hypothetical protein